MNNFTLFSLLLFSTSITLNGGPHCIGYTEMNAETGVEHDGPLRNLHCVCECAKFDRSNDNRCTNCLHHQAGQPETVKIQVIEDQE